MDYDRRSTDRLPFHDADEAPHAPAGAPALSRDAQIRHLQRVPLFSGFDEPDLRRVAEMSRIVEAPAGTVITQIGQPGDSFFVIIDGMVAVRTPAFSAVTQTGSAPSHPPHQKPSAVAS